MGEITIDFVGICAHLPALGAPGQPHRVVVIQNPDGTTIGGVTISPHTASIKIVSGNLIDGTVPTDLSGLMLSIQGPVGGNVSYAITWGAIPSLSQFSNDPLSLNDDVAFNGLPPVGIALTYFNVFSGAFVAGWVPSTKAGVDKRKPVGAAVTINTSADNPTLLYSNFDGSSPGQATFSTGTILELINDAQDDSPDQDSDFLLHFQITSPIPSAPVFPTQTQFSGLLSLPGLRDGHDITTGCSNSAYP